MGRKTVKVTGESATGRNLRFQDTATGDSMSRAQFVQAIERGQYPEYHVRRINSIKTPVSNPDEKSRNNLG